MHLDNQRIKFRIKFVPEHCTDRREIRLFPIANSSVADLLENDNREWPACRTVDTPRAVRIQPLLYLNYPSKQNSWFNFAINLICDNRRWDHIHWILRKALASCSSPSALRTTQTYSPRSVITVGLMLKLPSEPMIDRWLKSNKSESGTPSLNQFANDRSGYLVTQWKNASSPSITVWLIGGILINEPLSTAKWNHVPLFRMLGVRFGNITRHSYQPESDSRIDVKLIEAFP